MDQVFLDANVLYSAAYLEHSGLARLWLLDDVTLVTSTLALEEAQRNLALDRPAALVHLRRLVGKLSVVDAPADRELPGAIRLEPKDRPILLAAIHAGATHLLTGDVRHFQHLFGKRIAGVLVLRPAQYFAARLSGKSQ